MLLLLFFFCGVALANLTKSDVETARQECQQSCKANTTATSPADKRTCLKACWLAFFDAKKQQAPVHVPGKKVVTPVVAAAAAKKKGVKAVKAKTANAFKTHHGKAALSRRAPPPPHHARAQRKVARSAGATLSAAWVTLLLVTMVVAIY